MPEPLDGRDASCAMLTRLRSVALLKLRDRARAAEAEPPPPGGLASPARKSSRVRNVGGKATAEMLQDLYLKARIREVEEAKKLEDRAREEAALRGKLGALSAAEVDAAVRAGWDGLQDTIEATLGDSAWARCVNRVPDEWEEEEALDAIADLLRRPATTEHIWLVRATED